MGNLGKDNFWSNLNLYIFRWFIWQLPIKAVIQFQLYNKTLFYGFMYCVWEIILGFLSWEIKSYFPGNKVAYVLKFGECGKKPFLIKFELTVLMKKSCYEVELEKW